MKLQQTRYLVSLLFVFVFTYPPVTVARTADDVDDIIEQHLDALTNEQKAAQIIMVYYANNNFIKTHEFGSVLVMQNMLKKPATFKQRLANLNSELLIGAIAAIDQEGGKVNRLKKLPDWKYVPSARSMREWEDQPITELANKMGAELKHLGIQMNLAPVLDPGRNHSMKETFMEKSQRSFGSDVEQILPKARAFIDGFRLNNVLTISKHFPGYDVHTNSDHEIAVSDAPFKSIINNTVSFAALSGEVDGVMMSSILFAEITDQPAVLSPFMVTWAKRLYKDKPVITDDLWGFALRSWVGPEFKFSKHYPDEIFLKLVRSALTAGNDILMITYPKKAVLMKNAIASWLQEDENLRLQVDESIRKVLRLKLQLGLLPLSNEDLNDELLTLY